MTAMAAEPTPMLDMNTTPLIDVMLVLLVMLIITIPPQSHAVKIDLPGPIAIPAPDPVKNLLVVTTDGHLLWNGGDVSKRQLRALLATTAAMDPRPELQLRPEAAARYAAVDEVLAMTKQAGVRSMGFVGNENYAKAL
jgi:biopolymer transport protein ExbD